MVQTPLLTVDCVVFNKNNLVLIRRLCEPFKGLYALPGGFVNIGESVEMACLRELKEETGLIIEHRALNLVGVYSSKDRDPRSHIVSVAFVCESTLNNLKAGDDAASVEVISDWEKKNIKIAFDHNKIIKDAWIKNNMNKEAL